MVHLSAVLVTDTSVSNLTADMLIKHDPTAWFMYGKPKSTSSAN